MKLTKREKVQGLSVALPMVLYFCIFTFIPLGMMVFFSFTDKHSLRPESGKFIGFANYAEFFRGSEYISYLSIFGTTILISVFTIAISVIVGFLIAKLLTLDLKGKEVLRTIWYIPVVISMAIVSQMTKVVIDPVSGVINNILLSLHIVDVGINFYESTAWMLFWIIGICIWKGLGATIVLYIAGLQSVPTEMYEAADIDGANGAQKLWYITIPAVKPMTGFVMITSIIGAFNIFEPVQLISGGGPNGTTKVILYQIYDDAFLNFRLGFANATSVIVMIFVFILTKINMKLSEVKYV